MQTAFSRGCKTCHIHRECHRMTSPSFPPHRCRTALFGAFSTANMAATSRWKLQITHLVLSDNWKANTFCFQSVPENWLTAKSFLSSRFTLFSTGKLRESHDFSRPVYPSKVMSGFFLHSLIILLQTQADIRLNNTAMLATHLKTATERIVLFYLGGRL